MIPGKARIFLILRPAGGEAALSRAGEDSILNAAPQ